MPALNVWRYRLLESVYTFVYLVCMHYMHLTRKKAMKSCRHWMRNGVKNTRFRYKAGITIGNICQPFLSMMLLFVRHLYAQSRGGLPRQVRKVIKTKGAFTYDNAFISSTCWCNDYRKSGPYCRTTGGWLYSSFTLCLRIDKKSISITNTINWHSSV